MPTAGGKQKILSATPFQVTRKTLDELWLHVTYQCNMACRHCLFACSPEKEEPGALTLEECQVCVEQALPQGLETIYLTGGEPLLWPHLKPFLDWYYSLDKVLPLTVLTNGTLISGDIARSFKAYAPQGFALRISLECYTRDNHEKYRGTGSFDLAVRGIKNLNAQGIRPWIAYVNKSGGYLDRRQTQGLERDFRLRLKKEYGLEMAGLKIIAAYNKGRFTGQVNPSVWPDRLRERLNSLQCTYGIAVSKIGIVPCPILADVPQAVLQEPLADLVGQTFSLDYDFCISCLASGTSCGHS